MSRPTTATIDLSAVRHNYNLAKSLSGEGDALAIIKANGYGHGAIELARALDDLTPGYGVACIEEAVELRDAGVSKPILLLEGFFEANELDYIASHNLWCAVHSLDQIAILEKAQLSHPINIWLKIDSGMHRLGIQPEQALEAYARLNKLLQVSQVTLMSHFARADELERKETCSQIRQLEALATQLNLPMSLANSAGILGHAGARKQWQRPGIMLYGATPFPEANPQGDQLKPVMTLSSQVIAVRDLPIGESVGYGATWTAVRPSRIGTVAMGYADGYPRHAKNGTPVLVDGVETQIIGRVSMDMLAVDLTNHPTAKIGSTIEFWGKLLSVNRVADWCSTIPYTLFTGITNRVHKRYI